jgi:hypothetical protein
MKRAGSRNRTGDLLITSQLLYQLSYAGLERRSPTLHAKSLCRKSKTAEDWKAGTMEGWV